MSTMRKSTMKDGGKGNRNSAIESVQQQLAEILDRIDHFMVTNRRYFISRDDFEILTNIEEELKWLLGDTTGVGDMDVEDLDFEDMEDTDTVGDTEEEDIEDFMHQEDTTDGRG